MIVWGGVFLSAVNTGGRYNPTTNKWTTLPPVALAPRAYMPAVWTGSEMIVWGGGNNQIGQVYNDGARYNPTTNTWKLTNPTRRRERPLLEHRSVDGKRNDCLGRLSSRLRSKWWPL